MGWIKGRKANWAQLGIRDSTSAEWECIKNVSTVLTQKIFLIVNPTRINKTIIYPIFILFLAALVEVEEKL